MGQGDPPLPENGLLPPGEVDGVGHDGAPPAEQAVVPVHLGVAGALRMELAHPGDLAPVLRQVGLDGQLVPLPQPPQAVHEPGGGGGDEAGGQDILHVLQLRPAAADELLRVRQGGVGVLPQTVRGIAVHVHLADEGGQPRPLGQLHQPPDGLLVDGGKSGEAQGAVGPHPVEEPLPRRLGKVRVAVAGLHREGVGLQPGQQLLVVAHAPVHHLGGVEVEVAEGGEHQRPAEVGHRLPGVLLGELPVKAGALLPLYHQVLPLPHGQLAQRGSV